MNKYIAAVGVILLLLAAFFFYVVFVGGSIGSYVITGGIPIANFAAFLFVILFLPIGSGLAYVGFAYKRPAYVEAQGAMRSAGAPSGSSGIAKAALAVAIIAILISAGTLAAVIAVSGQVSTLGSNPTGVITSTTTSSGGHQGVASVNATPTTRLLRVDWCNTDNTGQDRFCPSQIVVNQGDIVVILFEHNDTDAHTFTTILSGTHGYNLQINATFGLPGYTKINGTSFTNGMHNFLTNANYTGSCSNSGSFSQQTLGLSGTLCVSGASLLAPLGVVGVINPTPGSPLNASAPNGGLMELNDTNSVIFLEPGGNMSISYANAAGLSCTATACTNPETGLPSGGETWGIAAFQATSVGTFEYYCHYHISNGMFGYITVLSNAFCTSSPQRCGLNSTSTG